jgi:hypothetical protein
VKGEVDRAEYMARLLEECGCYADAVLVAFVRDDYPIAKDRFERAIGQSLGSVLRWIKRHSGSTAAVTDVAVAVGSQIGRYLAKEAKFSLYRDRVRELGHVHRAAPMHRVMNDVGTDLIALTIGGESDPGLVSQAAANMETLTGTGLLADPKPPPAHLEVGSFAALAQQLNLDGLTRIVRSATTEELARSRDAAKTMRTFARAYGRFGERRCGTGRAFAWLVLGNATDRTLAYAIPGFVLIRRLHGDRLDATAMFMAEWTPFFEAANTVLDELPTEFQILARHDGYESLTTQEQRQLHAHLNRIASTHPAQLELARNPPATTQIGDN